VAGGRTRGGGIIGTQNKKKNQKKNDKEKELLTTLIGSGHAVFMCRNITLYPLILT
jgi:hypothetical protein